MQAAMRTATMRSMAATAAPSAFSLPASAAVASALRSARPLAAAPAAVPRFMHSYAPVASAPPAGHGHGHGSAGHDSHSHNYNPPDHEDEHTHTWGGLTLQKPKRWHVYGAHFFAGLMWFWIIYRFKNDYKTFLMLEHPWEEHERHLAHTAHGHGAHGHGAHEHEEEEEDDE